jgi:hypothetical protein
MELIRAILLEIERLPDDRGNNIHIEGHPDEEVAYHIGLLHHAGLIEAINVSSTTSNRWLAKSLTWDGHEFLDAARSETVWVKAKDLALKATGALTVESVKAALPEVIKRLIADYFS